MSTRIRMGLVMNLLTLLFLVALVRSDQSTVPLRSFKISENVTYDCIDIYKQPGLDHPLLKTHKIQMKPTVSRSELKNQTSNKRTYKKNLGSCPDGTVPILRNTKEFITNAQLFAEKNLHPLSSDSPGTHIAGIRSRAGPFPGVEASFSGYKRYVDKHEASYTQIYIGSGLNNEVNFIQAGFMINPSLYGDIRVWTYGFWKGRDGKGCYNTACPGFVQVSREVPLVIPFDLKPEQAVRTRYAIHQDARTKNWWLTVMNRSERNDIGYWPKELFNLLDNGGTMVGVGGVTQGYLSGTSPPMGNGKFPIGDYKDSAIFANIKVLNSNYELRRIDKYLIEKLLDSPKCYGLRIGEHFNHDPRGYFFNYGGPGGRFCGV